MVESDDDDIELDPLSVWLLHLSNHELKPLLHHSLLSSEACGISLLL